MIGTTPSRASTSTAGIDRLSCSFFFQAEDGIRDYKVTGVQTCALPIFQPDHADGELLRVGTRRRRLRLRPSRHAGGLQHRQLRRDRGGAAYRAAADVDRDRKSVV